MTSTHLAKLPIPALPLAARMAHIVPALQSHSLVSIGTLRDAGCDVTFTTTTVTLRHNDVIVMAGTRTHPGLWHFAIPSPAGPITPTLLRNDTLAMSTIGYPNAAELVPYAHAAETLEDNRSRLNAEWNPDEGMEVPLYQHSTIRC